MRVNGSMNKKQPGRKRHQLSEVKFCESCGGPTRNASPQYCLSCLIRATGRFVWPFAIDRRFLPNLAFRGKSLLRFISQLRPPYNTTIKLLSKDRIIKLCEYVKMEVKLAATQGDVKDEGLRKPGRNLRSTKRFRGAKERIRLIREELLEAQDHHCPICKRRIASSMHQLDCILQTPFDHTEDVDTSAQATYYQAMHQAGLLWALCPKCHGFKAKGEKRANFILLDISSGKYVADTSITMESTKTPHWPVYETHKFPSPHDCYLTAEDRARLPAALSTFALRATCHCPHKAKVMFIEYLQEFRTLNIGCEKCVCDKRVAIDMRQRRYNQKPEARMHFRHEPYDWQDPILQRQFPPTTGFLMMTARELSPQERLEDHRASLRRTETKYPNVARLMREANFWN